MESVMANELRKLAQGMREKAKPFSPDTAIACHQVAATYELAAAVQNMAQAIEDQALLDDIDDEENEEGEGGENDHPFGKRI
jgi:hypothetical protein